MKNILRSLLGDKAYKQLLKLIGNGSGGSSNDGGIKALKVICNSHLDILSLGYDNENLMLYTSVQFGEDIPEDVKQQVLKGIETNKTFANSVLEAINNGEPVCINRVCSSGHTDPYTGQNTVFADYSFSYVAVTAKGVSDDPNAILLKDPSNSNNTFIAIPAAISDNKYILTDYEFIFNG